MAEAFAKFRVGRPGSGAAHASYITRMSAIDPAAERDKNGQLELGLEQTSVAAALDQDLNLAALDAHGKTSDVDPVWTWNAHENLTGDDFGIQHPLRASRSGRTDGSGRLSDSPNRTERLREKAARLRTYFGAREQFEKSKGGRTHYRAILSFDVPASNEQIRDLTNHFLKDTFPKAIGFAAIHRDTEHPHVHIYLHARQIDGKKIYLSRNAYQTIDENWARVYSEFAGDRSVYVEHLRKKEETRQWKIAAAAAYRKNEPIPPKPERDNDRRERLAEQRLSAQRSDARDKGKQIDVRPKAEPLSRPASEKETSRLLAKAEVAREHLAHLIRTDAPEGQIKSASRTAHDLTAVLDKTLAARKEMGRENHPQVVYTTEEWKQLKEYRGSSEQPLRDDQAAARLQAGRVVAGAEMKDAQGKAEAFQVSRHFWKFDVEGWDRQLSLKEVEQAIKEKTAEKLKLYNFLRPGIRESIQGQIEYLQEVKKDVQKQLAAKELGIKRSVGAAEFCFEVANLQGGKMEKERDTQGRLVPRPVYHKDELIKMDDIANRNKDAPLLLYVYEQIKDRLLASPTREAVSRVKGYAVMAKLDALREAERLESAKRFGEFRQLPLKDAQGRDYTKSIRDVAPRNALETMIRHFTDSAEQKKEARDLADALREQLARAEERTVKARDFSTAMTKILGDHYRAAGLTARQVSPLLNAQQIAEIREYTEKLPPLNSTRTEFNDHARQAEQSNQQREATERARQAEESRARDEEARSREREPSRQRDTIDRPDSYSRGR